MGTTCTKALQGGHLQFCQDANNPAHLHSTGVPNLMSLTLSGHMMSPAANAQSEILIAIDGRLAKVVVPAEKASENVTTPHQVWNLQLHQLNQTP